MNTYDALEQAYKNGYKQGQEDLLNRIKEYFHDCIDNKQQKVDVVDATAGRRWTGEEDIIRNEKD